jgi:hypothetical protein
MRKSDKNLNITKTNILVERRYLESKVMIKENIELKKGDKIVWVGKEKKIGDKMIMPSMEGEYIGRESSGEYVVEFGSKRFYANDFEFELTNG